MLNNQFLKAGMGVMLSSALLISACSDATDDKKTQSPKQLVEAAKLDIAAKRYPDALNKCTAAEEIDDSFDEAKYCILATNMGSLVQSVASIISLLATQLSPADYQAQINAKQLVSSVLSDIEGQMAYIDAYAYKLAAMDNPHFQINDFPLGLDPSDLLSIIGEDDLEVKGDLSLNMRGTWDKSEVAVLGATINGVQAIIDYLLSHKLILDSTEFNSDGIDGLSTEDIANFLINNPDLAAGDTADTDRLLGGGTHKGLRLGALAAISYLVGRDSDLEKVAPAFPGLKEAIKVSAAEAAPDAVVKWVDADGDGIPEKIGLPAITELKDKILVDGEPLIKDDEFENPLSAKTWESILKFGIQVRDNIDANGGDAIGLAEIITIIMGEFQDSKDAPRILAEHRPVPDLIGINPGAFLKDPKYVADMLPYFFQFTTDATAKTVVKSADLAVEIETYVGATTWYNEKVGVKAYSGTDSDFVHFDYADNDDLGPKAIEKYYFDAFDAPPALIEEDGIKADVKSPLLYYIALQDPTLGGLLQGDITVSGNYGDISNASFNEGLARLVKYYCLDLKKDFIDAFLDSKYDESNKIADCTADF